MERELEEMREWREQIEQEREQYQQPEQAVNPMVQEWGEAIEEGHYDKALQMMWNLAQSAAQGVVKPVVEQSQNLVRPIAEAQTPLLADAVDRAMADRFPDWEGAVDTQGNWVTPPMKEAVKALIAEDPGWLPEDSVRTLPDAVNALTRAYEAAQYRRLTTQGGTVAPQGVDPRARKLEAATLPGQSGRQEGPDYGDQVIQEMKAAGASSYGQIRRG
jgi:hypothetical protein